MKRAAEATPSFLAAEHSRPDRAGVSLASLGVGESAPLPPVESFPTLRSAFDAEWVDSRLELVAHLRAHPEADAERAGYQRAEFHVRNDEPYNATVPCDQPYQAWVRGYRARWAEETA